MTQMPDWLANVLAQTEQPMSPLGAGAYTVPAGPTIEPLLTEAGLYEAAAPSVRDMLRQEAMTALFPQQPITSPRPSWADGGPSKATPGSEKASNDSGSPKSSKSAGGSPGVGASDGGMGDLRKMLETVFPVEVPSKRLMKEREKTLVLQERLKRNQIASETRAGRRIRELQNRLSFLGVDYDPEADIGELERLLVQHRRERNMKNGPGKPLSDEQKKMMSEGVRQVPYVSESESRRAAQKKANDERAERGKKYAADQEAKKRQRAANALTGGDTRTLDYIDTENMPADVYREMVKRRREQELREARNRGARGIARFARPHEGH
jgi:hypothetical protein